MQQLWNMAAVVNTRLKCNVTLDICKGVFICNIFLCSPDEGALVRAAQNLGFVFSGRTPDSVIVEIVSWTKQVKERQTALQVCLIYNTGIIVLWSASK